MDLDMDDVEFHLEASEDDRVVKITVTSSKPMSSGDLVVALECYLHDLTKALTQKEASGDHLH